MRMIITGGGTGGHIYPALAIAQGVLKTMPKAEILYVGTKKGLEADIVPKSGLPFRTIDVEGLSRPFSYRTLLSLVKAVQGSFAGVGILNSFKPQVVVGTGGYVCGPIVLAAAILGIPTLIHEQNAFPGLTNRILGRFTKVVCLTFSDAAPYFPRKKIIKVTGLPVREEILQANRKDALKNLNLDPSKLTVIITGGSQGARSINLAMAEIYKKYTGSSAIQFYHLTGQKGYKDTIAYYQEKGIGNLGGTNIHLLPYLYQMGDALAVADLIIGRGGASFLAEIMVKGIPSIIVPYPFASADHQVYNAQALEKNGAAQMVLDRDLETGELLKVLESIINNPKMLGEMGQAAKSMGKEKALDEIIQLIIEISKNKAP